MFLISLSLSLSLSSIHRLLPSTTGVKGYHRYYQTTFPPFDKKSLLRNQFSDSGAFESLMAFDIFFFLFSFSFLSFFFSLLSAERIFFFAARRVYSRCNATWIVSWKFFEFSEAARNPLPRLETCCPDFCFAVAQPLPRFQNLPPLPPGSEAIIHFARSAF